MKILFAAGGTGGHIIPARNLAEWLDADADRHEVRFLTAGRKIEDPDELERLRSRLLEVLASAPSPAKSRGATAAHDEPVSPTPSHAQPKAPSPADTPAE